MIKVDRIDDGLPVSVIVPLGQSQKRKNFFNNIVYPMIEANNPIEIIINDDIGTAPVKRNNGFKKSTQPFVFFCDDDCLLPQNYFEKLYECLLKNPKKSYAYTGYYGVVFNPTTQPNHNFTIPSIEFNGALLRQQNYINTTSLIKREDFPFFDESLKRFQDWDLWLTMLSNCKTGVMVKDLMFYSFFNDEGQTNVNNNYADAYNVIRNKHNL